MIMLTCCRPVHRISNSAETSSDQFYGNSNRTAS